MKLLFTNKITNKIIVALLLLTLAACGSDADEATPTTAAVEAPTATTASPATTAPAATATTAPEPTASLAPVAEATITETTSTEITSTETTTVDSSAALTQTKQDALATYADIVFASYQDSLTTAIALQTAIDAFVANPSPETQQAAKDAWLAAREPYGQTEAYRFYGGPIDDEDGPDALLNSWPLDEVYIDYVEGAPDAGIINNLTDYPEITQELLASLNEVGAEENISTGYHAIEFLLWGQDQSKDGSGQRPYTDYVVNGGAANADRRGQYLKLLGKELVENLTGVTNEWDPAVQGNYRTTFLAMAPDAAIEKILTGLGILSKSELAGERMFTALDNRDQEDEHSCFSDNTHRDIFTNAQGIVNVYLGSYTRPDGSVVSGTGLADVVGAVNPELNERMKSLLEQSMTKIKAIHIPFDQAIIMSEERNKVLDAVIALQDQGDTIAEVASVLGLTINTALP